MNIELHAPHSQLTENLVDCVRDKLINLHCQHTEARVHFHEQVPSLESDKLCDVALRGYKDSVFVRGRGSTYAEAAKRALEKLAEKLDRQIRPFREVRHSITNTI